MEFSEKLNNFTSFLDQIEEREKLKKKVEEYDSITIIRGSYQYQDTNIKSATDYTDLNVWN